VIVLVLGGTRSGKSAVAESMAARLAGADSSVTYVATARLDPGDSDHAARIEAHRARRPASWTTIECPVPTSLPALLRDLEGVVLLDSIGTWVTGHPLMDPDIDPLVDALRARTSTTIVVSEEVGLAPHAPSEVGRRFADVLGEVNRSVSAVADHALLVVAGRAIPLPPPGDLPC
jgi:adenosyl cobinamide kinase/adenosyl cobinamide phosphate guanylyltransferase